MSSFKGFEDTVVAGMTIEGTVREDYALTAKKLQDTMQNIQKSMEISADSFQRNISNVVLNTLQLRGKSSGLYTLPDCYITEPSTAPDPLRNMKRPRSVNYLSDDPNAEVSYCLASHLSDLLRPDNFQYTIARMLRILGSVRVHFDALAFTGISGTFVAGPLAHALQCHTFAVRKTTDGAHSPHMAEGPISPPMRYMIVDDLIDSGSTVKKIVSHVRGLSHWHKCTGIVLYDADRLYHGGVGQHTIHGPDGKQSVPVYTRPYQPPMLTEQER